MEFQTTTGRSTFFANRLWANSPCSSSGSTKASRPASDYQHQHEVQWREPSIPVEEAEAWHTPWRHGPGWSKYDRD
eukprot:12913825-Prorocentrum_lima.AAC.1